MSEAAASLDREISQLGAREQKAAKLMADLDAGQAAGVKRLGRIRADLESLQKDIAARTQSLHALQARLASRSVSAACEYVPRLLESVDEYGRTMMELLDDDGAPCQEEHTSLGGIGRLCAGFESAAGEPRQEVHARDGDVEAHARKLSTLMMLLSDAGSAHSALEQLAQGVRAHVGGDRYCEVVHGPIKGVPRAVRKTQLDYDGDYSRLLDLARVTLVFPTVSLLERGLSWFLMDARKACGFRVVRIKDRMSDAWDAELSGGNRDVLINGTVTLPTGCPFIVEVQLHLKALFRLKKDLHTLYSGARVLALDDTSMTEHSGPLTEHAITLAEKGIIRSLQCHNSPVPKPQLVARLLQATPCALLTLELNAPYTDGEYFGTGTCHLPGASPSGAWRLADLLLMPVHGLGSHTLSCTRLRCLEMARQGLVGPLPAALGQLVSLQRLYLHENHLEGHIPAELGSCRQLSNLCLHSNPGLCGPVPTALLRCPLLKLDLQQHEPQLTIDDELRDRLMSSVKDCRLGKRTSHR